MRRIPFVKYTCYGNNFVIVDQADEEILSEEEMSAFARAATDTAFGVGCDNLLVVQRCEKEILARISKERGYWARLPEPRRADFIFRMFEPDGQEALCCGNGLACIADYLGEHHQQSNVTILTEVPLQRPSTLRIGSIRDEKSSWVDLGPPRRMPPELVTPGATIPYAESIEIVEDMTVQLRAHDLEPYSNESELSLSGYLIFTGEPHLVVYPDESFLVPEIADSIFRAPPGAANQGDVTDQRASFGTSLIHHIGSYLNTTYRSVFPAGVSVNFVRVHDTDIIEYRCFERGIDRETLACGTGALASAYISHHLRGVDQDIINVLPHRCRWYDAEARIRVSHNNSVWMLESSPIKLFEGSYNAVDRALQGVGATDDQQKIARLCMPHTGSTRIQNVAGAPESVTLQ